MIILLIKLSVTSLTKLKDKFIYKKKLPIPSPTEYAMPFFPSI